MGVEGENVKDLVQLKDDLVGGAPFNKSIYYHVCLIFILMFLFVIFGTARKEYTYKVIV